MNIRINGTPTELEVGASVRDAVVLTTGRDLDDAGAPRDGRRLGIAVAVDAEVVPRARWTTTVLAEGASVEILTAVQGG